MATWLLWGTALVLIGVGWGIDEVYLAILGLAVSAAAAALWVIADAESARQQQRRRERDAFDLGRESVSRLH